MAVERQADAAHITQELLAGRSPRYLVTGEVGSGKSWFTAEAASMARSSDIDVAEVSCVEFEADVAFLPLALLMAQLGVDHPTGGVLDTVLGHDGPLPNVLTLGAAVAEVLHNASAARPVLVVVDDAHWADADSLQVMLFAARRLDVASVGFVFTTETGANERLDRSGLTEIKLDRWSTEETLAWLADQGLPGHVALTCAELSGGNPLALKLLVASLDDDARSGRVPMPSHVPIPSSVADRVGAAFSSFDSDTRRAMAIAAVLDGADSALLDDVFERCGSSRRHLEPALELGTCTIDRTIRWTSPLSRSAALRLLGPSEIATVHGHTADAAASVGDDDLVLRHRAAAGIGVDDQLADQLESAGTAAASRGARLTAAEALRQAGVASSRPEDRARRLLDAATHAFVAGNSELTVPYARAGLEVAEGETWATTTSLLGEALLWTDGWASADRVLLDGARIVGDKLPGHATAMLIHATIQAVLALDAPAAEDRHQLAAQAAATSDDPVVQVVIPLIEAIAHELAGGARTADAVLADCIDIAYVAINHDHPIGSAMAELVGFAAIVRGDVDAGFALLRAANDAGRAGGAVGLATLTSFLLSEALWRSGRWSAAIAEIGQAVNLVRDSGVEFLAELGDAFHAFVLAATGQRDECIALAHCSLARSERLGLGFISQWGYAAIGLCELSHGRPDAAADAFEAIDVWWSRGGVHEPNLLWWQADHVEALVLASRERAARTALDRYRADADLTGRRHAGAGVARCEALLEPDPSARRSLLDTAVDEFRAVNAPFDEARSLLMRGELLVGVGEHAAGATDIATARVVFDRLGARPWSDRASASRHEGGTQPTALADVLSEAELRVALTVAEGATNREAAQQLFVSSKTVEYHLSNIYRKLGIRSRVDLARRVAGH